MTRPKSNTNKRKGSSRSDRANTTRDSGNGDGSDLGSEIVVDDDEDEVEVLDIGLAESLADVGVTTDNFADTVSLNASINCTVAGKKTKFSRGDKIWYLSRITATALGDKAVARMEDIPDECFDVAEILDACVVTPPGGNERIGYLRVQHYYTKKQALALPTLHSEVKAKLKQYQLWFDERICSDHIDFISPDSYAGPAGIWCALVISGLEIPDVQQLLPPHERPRSSRKVELKGFTTREKMLREEAREEEERESTGAEQARNDARTRKRANKSSHRRNADESQQICVPRPAAEISAEMHLPLS